MGYLCKGILKHAVQQAGEVSVQALISGDELIGKSQPRHEASLLEPEDGAEAAGEVDAFHTCKRDKSLCKAAGGTYPVQCPLSLLLDTGNGLYCLQKSAKSAGISTQRCFALLCI